MNNFLIKLAPSLTVLILICSSVVRAQMFESGEEKLDFTDGKANREATWSNGLVLTAKSLEMEPLMANQSRDIWVQTHPFPIGMSWRPPQSARLSVYVTGSINDLDPMYSIRPGLFYRYSSDRWHWSSWYLLNLEDKAQDGASVYTGNISMPQVASENYRNKMREWWQTKPIWKSDEHEFCEWLVKKDPGFFANEIPFVGYVQVRLEKDNVTSAQRLLSMRMKYDTAVGGLMSPVADKTRLRKTVGDRWFFRGKP